MSMTTAQQTLYNAALQAAQLLQSGARIDTYTREGQMLIQAAQAAAVADGVSLQSDAATAIANGPI
jgi:hypothetical protein